MSMLVDRTPVPEAVVEALIGCMKDGEEPDIYIGETITREDLTADGRIILARELPGKDGIVLHGTRWGRAWCAFETVE